MKQRELNKLVNGLKRLIKEKASCSYLDGVEEKARESRLVRKTCYTRELGDTQVSEELILFLTGDAEISITRKGSHYWIDVMPCSLDYTGKNSIHIIK